MSYVPARGSGGPLDFDYILVGGGLQNALVALAVLRRRPDARLALVERGRTLGGNHRWSCHLADLPGSAADFAGPLLEVTWPAYEVRFPRFSRRLESRYASFDSRRLHDLVVRAVEAAPGSHVFTGCLAAVTGRHEVVLEHGRILRAPLIVDARGPERFAASRATPIAGYQKFVGLEMELVSPSRVPVPCLMDAAVEQADGFRFFYVLPVSATQLLVEDTYFSDSSALDRTAVRDGILAYCARRGFEPARIIREEHGVLPLPARSAARPQCTSPLAAGYMGGWFHPTTGYSFPAAIRLAALVAALDPYDLGDPHACRTFDTLVREHHVQTRFATALNRMLFGCFAPGDRRHVLERFYRLPEASIHRFYAMTTTRADRARILCGRPPRGFSPARALARGVFA